MVPLLNMSDYYKSQLRAYINNQNLVMTNEKN